MRLNKKMIKKTWPNLIFVFLQNVCVCYVVVAVTNKKCHVKLVHMSVYLIIVLLVFRIVLLLLLSLPLANLASVGLLAVQVGENQVKDFRVPAHSVAFDAFFDGLYMIC